MSDAFPRPLDDAGRLERGVFVAVQVISLSLAVFHIYTAYAGPFYAVGQRATHVGLAMALAFLTIGSTSRRRGHLTLTIDVVATLVVLGITAYVVYHRYRILRDLGFADPTPLDTTLGYVMVALVVEASRRVVGWPFATLLVGFLLYGYFGPWMPGILAHRGIALDNLINTSFLNPMGIYGNLVAVSATTIAVYVFFGSILLATGGATAFLTLALVVGGRVRGGGAQVAVISSGFMGMINGSAVANTASTGAMTIPMMKRQGYPAHISGAVESAASAGGQLTPPIMGAGAFVMAEILGVPYLQIALMAIIPAMMYYGLISTTVYFEARKRGIEPLDRSQLPKLRDHLRELAIFVVPVGVLIFLLADAYTPRYSGFWAIATCVALFVGFTLVADRDVGLLGRLKRIAVKLYDACLDGARTVVTIAVVVAAAQVVVAVVGLTGIGLKTSRMIFAVADQNLLAGFILAAVINLILGMGLPTVPAYIITVAVVGPALINLGADPIVVHFFCFFYACLSGLTPPVATISFVAAGIAQSSVWTTSFHACRLAIAGYLVPMIFAFHPEILGMGEPMAIVGHTLFGLLGCALTAAGLTGFWVFNLVHWQRACLIVAGPLTMVPDIAATAAGLGLAALALLSSALLARKTTPIAPPAATNATTKERL
jgi:TRAP transporter 4TM/12TM fusion protein